jgi:hypothetical protein
MKLCDPFRGALLFASGAVVATQTPQAHMKEKFLKRHIVIRAGY